MSSTTRYPDLKLNDNLILSQLFACYEARVYKYEFKNAVGDKFLEFTKNGYPSCCGIQILSAFSCRGEGFVKITEEMLKEFFNHTREAWSNKTQFVAIKHKQVEWEEDDDGDDVCNLIGHEDLFEYNNFIEPLIKVTKAKLISKFLNENSNNMCYVYEFDGKDLV